MMILILRNKGKNVFRIGGIIMDNAQAVRILTVEKSWQCDDKTIGAFALGIDAIEKIEKLNNLTDLFEDTFDYSCDDRVRRLYTNAVYAIIIGNETLEELYVNEFRDYVLEMAIPEVRE